jgi:hypothetical protein
MSNCEELTTRLNKLLDDIVEVSRYGSPETEARIRNEIAFIRSELKGI